VVSLKEEEFTLPTGPVFLFPNSLVDALKAEVGDKVYGCKISTGDVDNNILDI
jgi:hypothetical protein